MPRISIFDNYRVIIDGEEKTFQASSHRQAWYQAYELADGDLIEALDEIDADGNVVDILLEREE